MEKKGYELQPDLLRLIYALWSDRNMESNQRECSEQPVATQSGGDGASGQPDASGGINNHQNATGSPPVTNQGQETSLMEDLKQIANYLTEKRAPIQQAPSPVHIDGAPALLRRVGGGETPTISTIGCEFTNSSFLKHSIEVFILIRFPLTSYKLVKDYMTSS
jgi:hypothetical protein